MPYRSRHDVGTQPVKIRVRPEYAERYPTLDPQKWYPAQSDHSGVLIFLADTSIPSIRADHCELELPYRRSSGTTVREFLHAGRAIYAELLPSRYMPVHVSRRRPRWVVFDPVVGQRLRVGDNSMIRHENGIVVGDEGFQCPCQF